MKYLGIALLLLYTTIINSLPVYGQQPKGGVPQLLANGQIVNKEGKPVGNFDKYGTVTDATGKIVAYYLSPNTLYKPDKQTRIAKTDVHGNLYVFKKDGKVQTFKLESPENGSKESILKDKSGKILGKVHWMFQDGGAAALYILNEEFYEPSGAKNKK